ncbi:MAG: NAD(P)H-dependent oxidoreductase subunit E [Thermoflexales bacterium]|nr:NAD(P)H-dependent oxidoreductase subunit E [Thermoflexales bacterium]
MLRTNRAADIEKVFAKYPTKRSAVMPLLYLAQAEYGYCSPEAIREVAELCELDPTEVKSVTGFYTMFNESPTGKVILDVCDDLPCALRGADAFMAHCESRLGIKAGETTADGKFTLRSAMCLAACNRAPLLQANGDYHYDLTPESFDKLIDELGK